MAEETIPDGPQSAPERPEDGAEVQYTGDNLEAVRAFLGSHYDTTRGGLTPEDPYVVWFYEEIAPKNILRRAYPGDWLVRAERGLKKAVVVLADEEYRALAGR